MKLRTLLRLWGAIGTRWTTYSRLTPRSPFHPWRSGPGRGPRGVGTRRPGSEPADPGRRAEVECLFVVPRGVYLSPLTQSIVTGQRILWVGASSLTTREGPKRLHPPPRRSGVQTGQVNDARPGPGPGEPRVKVVHTHTRFPTPPGPRTETTSPVTVDRRVVGGRLGSEA